MIFTLNTAKKIAISAVILLHGSAGALCAEKQRNTEDHLQSISKIINALKEVQVEKMESNIPPIVRKLFPKLKHEMLAVIIETLNDRNTPWNKADDLKKVLISKLKKAGIKLPDNNDKEEETYSYDGHQDITVEKPAHHDDLLVVTTSLWVMCGDDTSFYLFKKEKGLWNLLLAEEVNGYNQISDAHGLFGYSISPPDKKGNFYIVTANVNPWCSSYWQGLHYAIYRHSKLSYHPKVLLRKKEIIYLGTDFPYKMETKADEFTLKFSGDWCSTPDAVVSHQSVTYKVGSNNASRIKKHCRPEE